MLKKPQKISKMKWLSDQKIKQTELVQLTMLEEQN